MSAECSSCGSAFASADARFCHMCGLQREQETQALQIRIKKKAKNTGACALCQNQTDSKIKGKHLVETARLLGVRGPRQRILRWNDWCCKGCRSDLSKKFATATEGSPRSQ